MAKSSAKSVAGSAKPKKALAKSSASPANIEKASEQALLKLKSLDIAHQLQADIEWCLGSYRADGNPVGLYDMTSIAVNVLKEELKKKTKGVTAKGINELEKALAAR